MTLSPNKQMRRRIRVYTVCYASSGIKEVSECKLLIVLKLNPRVPNGHNSEDYTEALVITTTYVPKDYDVKKKKKNGGI